MRRYIFLWMMLVAINGVAQVNNQDLILESCQGGIEAAKKRGVKFGRREGTKVPKPKKSAVLKLYKAGTPVLEIQRITGIKSLQTIYNYLKETGVSPNRNLQKKKQ